MGKRTAIITIIVLFTGVLLFGWFLNQNRKSLVADPYRVIGTDAGIVIETYDLKSLINSVTTGKGIFPETGNVSELGEFSRQLKYLADQINKPGFKRILQEGTFILSFHEEEGGELAPFFSRSLPADIHFRNIKEALEGSGINRFSETRFFGKKVIVLPYTGGEKGDTLYVSAEAGLLFGTTSERLIKSALTQSPQSPDIRKAGDFSKLLRSAGKNENKIFFIFENLKKTREKILPPEAPVTGSFILPGNSLGGDLIIDDSGITISGYCEVSDASGFEAAFGPAEPSEFETYKVLPSSTSLFKSMKLVPRLKARPPGNTQSGRIHDLAVRLLPYLGDEITRAYINIKDNPVNQNTIVIYKLRNRVQCENILNDFLGGDPPVRYFRPDEQTRIPVYVTEFSGLGSVISQEFTKGAAGNCFAFYDNYMVTGNSYATISRFLYDNILNKTLANDVFYRDFEKKIASRAGYLFYCVPSQSLDHIKDFFSDRVSQGLASNKSSLDKIQSAGFQLASINGMIYSNLSVSYLDFVREESPTEWETLLDTTAGIKPFFFTNHNTGAKEIFIQDTRNNAYLINAAGRVLWKVPLREKINGQIYMIDYYRNGKYQLLFSGKNHLHLLDRNGNYVDRYPVRLRSPATNSLSLIDYDNNKNYRLLIAGEDKQMYMYDRSGSVVKGWEPFRTAGYVSGEASYYKISGKDFIVVADESSVYLLDRYGKTRLRLNDAVTKAKGSALRLAPGSEPYLICSAPDGTVQNIYFNGNVKKFTLREFSFDHSFDFFDVDGDGFGEYLFIDKGILYLYDNNLKEMFSKDFSSPNLGGPINFTFSSADRKIGVFDIDRNLIYLISQKGETVKGFPLRGASMFSIGKLSSGAHWNLIVGGADRFLYNYKLETVQK